MATPTYTLIDSTTLASTTTSVTFSSLDTVAAGYKDLILITEYKTSANGYQLLLRYNADTGTNYSYVQMFGDGSSALSASGSFSWQILGGSSSSATTATFVAIQFLDFNSTDKHKSILARQGNLTTGEVYAVAGRWADTSAITSILCEANGTSFTAGSTFYLYGIEA